MYVRVKSGTGEVLDVATGLGEQRASGPRGRVYRMGMEKYQELKRQILAGKKPIIPA
jgi:hypothetical protein